MEEVVFHPADEYFQQGEDQGRVRDEREIEDKNILLHVTHEMSLSYHDSMRQSLITTITWKTTWSTTRR